MFIELPKSAAGLTTNNRTSNSHWGKLQVITALQQIGELWAATKTTPISVGQISRRNGGPFPPHKSHRTGIDVDIRPMRKDGKNLPVTVHDKQYDAGATRAVVEMIRGNAKVKLILFNDPALVASGLTRKYAGHDNHLHIRFDY